MDRKGGLRARAEIPREGQGDKARQREGTGSRGHSFLNLDLSLPQGGGRLEPWSLHWKGQSCKGRGPNAVIATAATSGPDVCKEVLLSHKREQAGKIQNFYSKPSMRKGPKEQVEWQPHSWPPLEHQSLPLEFPANC